MDYRFPNLKEYAYCHFKHNVFLYIDIDCLLITFINSKANDDILLNFFSNGTVSLTSGSLIPTNNGFLRNTSLCLGVRLPAKILH